MSTIFDPNLDPELRDAIGYCSEAVLLMLGAAPKLGHDESDAQVLALAIYGTAIELFSACVGLAQLGEPTAIPIILRSMYESHVDLDNLLHEGTSAAPHTERHQGKGAAARERPSRRRLSVSGAQTMPLNRAAPEDARGIAQLHVATWQAAYKDIVPLEYLATLSVAAREAMWSESVSRNVPDILVSKENGAIVGFVAFGPCRDEDAPAEQAEIWAIYVAPSYWSAGIGRQLWLAAREHLVRQQYRSVSLWVLAQNVRATKFYLAAGFRPEPRRCKEWLAAGESLQEIRYIAVLSA